MKDSNKVCRLLAGASLLTLPVAQAGAQTIAEPASEVATEQDEAIDGRVIIVTAQRRSEDLSKTPVAVTVVTAEVLQELAIVTEADLQAVTPGLIVKTGQNDNQLNFSLRGQSVDPFSSSRPSVLPYFNEVQVGGVGGTSLYDLESVQVLKGPQGTLFGRNATGGAVLYTSKRPDDYFNGFATVRVGNYDALQIEGAINLPLAADGAAALRIAGFLQRRDGFQFNLFRDEFLGEVSKEGLRASLAFEPSPGLRNDLVVDYGHSDGKSLSSVVYNVLPLGEPAFVPFNFLFSPLVDQAFGPGTFDAYLAANPKVDPEGLIAFAEKQEARGPYTVDVDSPNFYRQNKWIVSNITTFDIGEETELKNVFGFVRTDFAGAGEFDGTPFGGDANGPDGRAGVIEQYSNELQVLGEIAEGRLDYVAGIFLSYETDETRSQSIIFDFRPISPPTEQINNGRFTNQTAAGYAQGTYELTPKLGLTAGARYTIENIKFERAADDTYVTSPLPQYDFDQERTFKGLSWTLGVDYEASDELLLYAKNRRSFRSGGFNYFAPPVEGSGNAAGGGYEPETATDVELGLKYRANGPLPVRFNLAAYQMWIEDVQRAYYAQIFGNLVAITVNVPEAEVRGVELDGAIEPTPWLTLGGSVNYTDAKFTENIVEVVGNPAAEFDTYPDTPEWSGVVYADLEAPLTNRLSLNVRGDIYAQTRTFFSSTALSLTRGAEIPGYELVNLRVGIQDEQSGLSLAGIVKNVTDTVYYTGGVGFANIFSLNTAVPGEPRTFLIEAKYRF
ncbi:TonB-dependent receptor [Altererythrobacter sp. SALINAS58]|uniref:TonB-dependent receptor n=1 Tax=Alteripontixanthobacter muriae TaxID=2705546 RepID=UPI00157685A3|nr:TonB-dependent receptor [Alteripontixanthobacter muriae]NTZ43808.1 TonB-dependent receptor [Alteripontixanthobacter muriae]